MTSTDIKKRPRSSQMNVFLVYTSCRNHHLGCIFQIEMILTLRSAIVWDVASTMFIHACPRLSTTGKMMILKILTTSENLKAMLTRKFLERNRDLEFDLI